MTLASLVKRLALRGGVDVRRAHNAPEHTLLGLRGRRFGTVLDVGANRGQFARIALQAFPGVRIHCFEPLAAPHAELSQWAATASRGLATAHNIALGECEAVLEMHEHVAHSASSSILATTRTAEELFPQTRQTTLQRVPVTTLDDWTRRHTDALEFPVLLKIDVQGYEVQVLRGARMALSAVEACIVEVSTVPLYEGQARFSELVALLDEAGLIYSGNIAQFHARDGSAIYLDALFCRTDHG